MARAGMALAGVALIGVGVLLASARLSPSSELYAAEPDERVDSVELATRSGDVRVRVGSGDSVRVEQRVSYWWGAPGPGYEVRDGTLLLEDCGRFCGADYDVVVPDGVTVTGAVRSGDVELTGVAGIELRARSGAVTGRDVTGPVRVTSRSGDIDLDLAEPADVAAEARSGDVTLSVPDARYRVDGSSRSGERRIEIPTEPDAEHDLTLDTRSGTVTVRPATAP
ncbi:DUF4097 family beta strand repeat-containing protein [Haloechinothrix alba]|nr:DUF4097 family beta strand repeat-containing protein [Haloechinothrix alba]